MIMERSVGPGGEAGKLDVGTGTPGLAAEATSVGKIDVPFGESRNAPVVIASVMSHSASGFYTARAHASTNAQFTLILQEEEQADQNHIPETVGWLAIDGSGGSLQSTGGLQVRSSLLFRSRSTVSDSAHASSSAVVGWTWRQLR